MSGFLRTTDGGISVIAHRGGSGEWRENTLEAFARARASGADGVELDARLTRDGVVVVHHDAELDSGQKIDELAYSELPSWLPDLTAVVAECEGMILNVEIKLDASQAGLRPDASRCRAVASGVAELLVRNPEKVIVSSFWPDALVAFGEVAARIATGLLVYPGVGAQGTEQAVRQAWSLGCSALHPFYLATTPTVVALCHQVGLEVAAWTVNPPADIGSLERSGVDAVITDDVPGTLAALGRGR